MNIRCHIHTYGEKKHQYAVCVQFSYSYRLVDRCQKLFCIFPNHFLSSICMIITNLIFHFCVMSHPFHSWILNYWFVCYRQQNEIVCGIKWQTYFENWSMPKSRSVWLEPEAIPCYFTCLDLRLSNWILFGTSLSFSIYIAESDTMHPLGAWQNVEGLLEANEL